MIHPARTKTIASRNLSEKNEAAGQKNCCFFYFVIWRDLPEAGKICLFPSKDFTFQCRPSSCDPAAGALCWSRGSCGAKVCVACPRSDRPLVGHAASCGATLPETLDGSSLNTSSAGHGALRHEQEKSSRETDTKD